MATTISVKFFKFPHTKYCRLPESILRTVLIILSCMIEGRDQVQISHQGDKAGFALLGILPWVARSPSGFWHIILKVLCYSLNVKTLLRVEMHTKG